MSCLSSLSPLCIFGIFFAQSNAFSLNFVSYKYLGPKQNPINIRHFIFRFVIFLWFSFFFFSRFYLLFISVKMILTLFFPQTPLFLFCTISRSFLSFIVIFLKSQFLCSLYHTLDTVVIALCVSTHLILSTSQGVSPVIYPHFPEEETEAQRGSTRAPEDTQQVHSRAKTRTGPPPTFHAGSHPERLLSSTLIPARHPLSRDPPMAPHSLMQTLCVPYRIP